MDLRKPAIILDRDDEWRALRAAWTSDRPELVFVVGRRRGGKSFLLTRFARAVGGLYYQASRRTEAEQLQELSRIAGEHFDDPALALGVPFPTWEALFRYITQRAAGAPVLVVFDEFPYLADASPALPSILQSVWDHDWPDTRVKVVLSGSHITAMTRFESGDQPLFGRRTAKLTIAPFDYADAAGFTPDYRPHDRLRTYGMFGGLPGHVALLDPTADLGANVATRMLTPSARLADEAAHMLDAFLADAGVHYSVVEAIAGGDHTWSRITNRVGREGGALLRPVKWLEDMEIIARTVPVTERVPRKSKRSVYRITDPYVAFWHRFVSPLAAAGLLGTVDPDRLWVEAIKPELDQYMGSVFEEACRTFVRRAARATGHRPQRGASALPFQPLRVGEWWDADGTNQVDVVALSGLGMPTDAGAAELLVGECKWGTVTGADLRVLRERAELVRREAAVGRTAIEHVHFALFSARPVTDRSVLAAIAAGDVRHYGIEALYE